MSAPTNRWKLGAFVAAGLLVGVAAVVLLTAQAMRTVTVTYTSYFDEAVTGLDVGSPVSYRGVKIGNVSAIDVAPDRRHVEVSYTLGAKVLKRLKLAGTSTGKTTKITIPPDLRVQIATTGLTGAKYLQLDFFDTGGTPPPALPFPVPENYIPATPSAMKNLEDSVLRAVEQLPSLVRELSGMVGRVSALLDDVSRRGLPGKAVATLDNTDHLLASARATLAKADRLLERLDGDDGLLSSVKRSSESLGDLAGPRLGASIEETGRDLRETAATLRQVLEALQRDPDMLLKGKAKVRQ
jgi:phospholipid/cholesterol/gamma-HCH transport system substrate-binding protein